MPNKPIEQSPDYLHLKHKYGFLANFTELYQAFYWSCRQRDIEINQERCDKFFMKYVENMGLEVEFEKAIIDPRTFTVSIVTKSGSLAASHKNLNAGRLFGIQKEFIPIIDIKGLTRCSLTIDGITYTIELEERNEAI